MPREAPMTSATGRFWGLLGADILDMVGDMVVCASWEKMGAT